MADFALFDADQHYYEPYDCFTRHIDPKFRDLAVHPVVGDDGIGRVYLGDRRLPFTASWYIDYVGAPGSLYDFYTGKVKNRKDMIDEGLNARDFPEFVNHDARLAAMDRQNVQAVFMIPTLGVSVEHDLHRNPDVVYANYRAFNRWLQEDWGFGADGRIYGVPYLSLVDPDRAAAEVGWLIGQGARAVAMRTGPIFGKSPADPSLDRMWAQLNEARIPVIFHLCDGGATYAEFHSSQFGENPTPPNHRFSAFQWATCNFERPIVDTVMALILHNLFGRFPDVRIVSIENGSDWVGHTLKSMDKAHKQTYGRESSFDGDKRKRYGRLAEMPSDIFRQHFWVNPFVEEDVQPLIDLIGAERVVWGSDFPHPEGVASPTDHAATVEAEIGVSAGRKVLRDNALALLR
jgi:predicted TIM-barrel fold metal-dependent hydrolase